MIFEQSGLGRPAVDSLINENRIGDFEYYRNYYLRDKDFTCVRTAIFAKHEAVTDNEGNRILNPEFADIQNGDVIITLSIHSLGWRHGHAAIVTNAETGETAQAVRIFEKSDFGTVTEWIDLPLVAVLRVKDIDEKTQNALAAFQLIAGLAATGELDKITWKHLSRHFTLNAHHNSKRNIIST